MQCPAEADRDIACLARQWNCPVLTNDSDFYIFDLPGVGSNRILLSTYSFDGVVLLLIHVLCVAISGGYLPLRFFQWTNLNGKASHRYIPARRYTTNGLCRWFGGINQELLPLCAVLTGNDYAAPRNAETLLDLLDVNALRRRGARGTGAHGRIEGILLWLSSFSDPAEALREVSELMGEEGQAGGGRGKRGQRSGLSSQLWAAMQEYNITSRSSLARWFSGDKAASGVHNPELPECLSQAAAKGLLPPLAVDAAVMRRVLLIPQVENSRLASSHCVARAIRQAVYGLLLLHKGQVVPAQQNLSQAARGGGGRGGRGGRGQGVSSPAQHCVNEPVGAGARSSGVPMCVEEYERLDLTLNKKQVDAHLPQTALRMESLSQVTMTTQIMYAFPNSNNIGLYKLLCDYYISFLLFKSIQVLKGFLT